MKTRNRVMKKPKGNTLNIRNTLLTAVILIFSLSTSSYAEYYRGVNLSGAEFGTSRLPGKIYFNYIYPREEEVDFFHQEGMNTFRVPFRWERIKHEAYGDLDREELKRLKKITDQITSRGRNIILDVHNYASYYGDKIGSNELPIAAFSDLWEKLAEEFKHNDNVFFGLMNEPSKMKTEVWFEAANAAIASIRNTGSDNLILVPGNGYSGASSWSSSWYGTPNSEVMINIKDPKNNFIYEVHQYFDAYSVGNSDQCVDDQIGVRRLAKYTEWLRENKKKALLGEFGAADNLVCLAALDNTLNFMEENKDVWQGWTYWSAGPWWGNYMFELPKEDSLKLQILKKYF